MMNTPILLIGARQKTNAQHIRTNTASVSLTSLRTVICVAGHALCF